jgi:predicted dehydrogenase
MLQPNRRQFIKTSVTAGLTFGYMLSSPARKLVTANKNDSINIGMISCGDRATGLAETFSKLEGVTISGACDPDAGRVAKMRETFPNAQPFTDMRELLASDEIDVVIVATTNHWHCLAAIWAMEAGKDVYVEKPLSHSQWEGEQAVAAARRFNRICQVGTQQRSDPMQTQLKMFLHESKSLGKLESVRVNRFGLRNSIGKLDQPLKIEKNIAYDLWLGPAQDLPIFRPKLHYDWHWDWNTGSGEMGNWGVHVLDDVRNVAFQDRVALPKKILSGGGRLVWNDAGQTPNVQFVYFDTGGIPVVIGLTNLPARPNDKADERKSPTPPGPGSGYIVYCEGGRLEGQRGSAVAFDNAGREIQKFSGNGGESTHAQNFLHAVRERKPELLNCDVAVGHHSTSWCNLANIAHRTAGDGFTKEQANEIKLPRWQELLQEMEQHLKAHNLSFDDAQFRFSPMLEIDNESERFVGENAELANGFIKRRYRTGYEVPELAPVTN